MARVQDSYYKILGYKEETIVNPEWQEYQKQIKEAKADLEICKKIVKCLKDFLEMVSSCKGHIVTAKEALYNGLVLGNGNNNANQKMTSIVNNIDDIITEINVNIDIFNGQISALTLEIEELEIKAAKAGQYIKRWVQPI